MPDKKETWYEVRLKGRAYRNKPKVYFTCHPEDFGRYFDEISEQILKAHDCVIYYAKDMSAPYEDENWQEDLEQMNLFVFPVTLKLLNQFLLCCCFCCFIFRLFLIFLTIGQDKLVSRFTKSA